MTESMLYPAPRAAAAAAPSSCEVSSLAEASRALRMMDRELALLRHEHQTLLDRFERMRLVALSGLVAGGCGLVLALVSLLAR